MKSDDHPNVIAPPPLIYLSCLILGLLLGYLRPIPWGWGPLRFATGGVLLLLGIAIGVAAVRKFRLSGTNIEVNKPATALVMAGPYKLSRNPIYLSGTLISAGIGFLANNLWILLLLIPTVVVIHFGVITREEGYLEAKFGAAYLRYKSTVRRWI